MSQFWENKLMPKVRNGGLGRFYRSRGKEPKILQTGVNVIRCLFKRLSWSIWFSLNLKNQVLIHLPLMLNIYITLENSETNGFCNGYRNALM